MTQVPISPGSVATNFHFIPEGYLTIARHFNAGCVTKMTSPVRTAEINLASQSFSTVPSGIVLPFTDDPGVETPGYFRLSRRDNNRIPVCHSDLDIPSSLAIGHSSF